MRKFLLLILLVVLLVPGLALAQQAPNCTADYSAPKLCNALPFFGGQAVSDIPSFIAAAFTWLATLVGTLVLVMFIFGGAQMIFAQGDPAAVTKGKGTITNAVYGLIVIMFGYVIVSAVEYFLGVRADIGAPGSADRSFFFNPLREGYLPQFFQTTVIDFLGILGAISLLYIVIAGFRYLTAGGNEEQVKKAKQSITWALIGLGSIILSYAIVNMIIGTISAV
ncbi:MAG TPA: hypothetical protein VEC17_02830 [Candidatus Binatia bacterium]|nr:hypothetical protein [Candidatus Binatia bacterium]